MTKTFSVFSLIISLTIFNPALCEESQNEPSRGNQELSETEEKKIEENLIKQKKETLLRRHINQFIPQNLTIDEKINLLEEQLYKSNLQLEKLAKKLQSLQNNRLEFILKSFKFNNKGIRLLLQQGKTNQNSQEITQSSDFSTD